jgi:hypothetical protein
MAQTQKTHQGLISTDLGRRSVGANDRQLTTVSFDAPGVEAYVFTFG